jgi:uncharacterized protein YcbX
MPDATHNARLANIRLHPIKGLDPVSVPEARIGPNGSLELDRVWLLTSVDGKWVNGKRSPAIHHIRAEYDAQVTSVALSVSGGSAPGAKLQPARFQFPSDFARAAEWFSEYFGQTVLVRHVPESVPDDGLAPGPTIVSTASLQQVCDTFPGVDLVQARERFRATLEVDGVPAFWEDQLFGSDENYVVRFKIGEVAFEGSNPCARCPVPPRNPRTGEETVGFSRTFSDMRRNTIPPWAPEERFDHYYRLSTNTRVPSSEQGKTLRVGDTLELR